MKPAVLQLIDSFNQGGSERQALQLTRLLSQSGRFNVYLASLSPVGSLRETIQDLNLGDIPSFPLNSFYDPNALVQIRRFVNWLRSARIDILHTHDFYTNVFGMTGAKLGRVSGRVASLRETSRMRTPMQKRVQKAVFSLADQIVVNSKAVQQTLIRDGVNVDKISIVYNGLDLNRVSPRKSRAEALSLLQIPPDQADRRFISIVANMRHEVKDYPMFLRAAQKVAHSVPEAAFLLAGEGELSGSLQKLAVTLGINNATYFLGRCENVGELLGISEICVLSSKAEGFSNSILEYMAAGRPVVATNVGGAAEAIVEGETGYLVASGDDEDMASRLITLLRDRETARAMGLRGKKVVEEKFSCEAQLARTEALYDSLLLKN